MVSSLKNIPNGWNVKLSSEVLFFQEGPGVRKWQFKQEGVKLLNGGNINNNTINLSSTKHYLSEDEAYNKYKHFLIDEGDLLIACSGITVNTFYKKIAFITNKDLPLCLNTSTMRFKSLADIELHYFYYYLQTNYFTKQIQRLITGSAQLNFGPSHMRKIEVLLPPLDQQKKIAAILDAADGYRQKTKALIEKYDELTQSLFLDMFGDPVTNPKGWERKSFTNVFGVTTGKLDSNQSVLDGQYPFFTCAKEVSSIDRYSFDQEALMLAGNNAAGVYDVKYYNGKFDAYQRTYVLTLNEGTNYQFFRFHLEQKLKELQKVSIGSGTKYLTMKILDRIMLLCPDQENQNVFTSRVHAIESQKAQAQASLTQAEDLFNSLLQRAFKGELV